MQTHLLLKRLAPALFRGTKIEYQTSIKPKSFNKKLKRLKLNKAYYIKQANRFEIYSPVSFKF